MKYAEKYGVSRASRKYNKKPVVHLLLESPLGRECGILACQSRRPHSHPNQHTEEELGSSGTCVAEPGAGMIELWHWLKKRGYTRCPESLFRVMKESWACFLLEVQESLLPQAL